MTGVCHATRSADLNSWRCVGDKTYLELIRHGLNTAREKGHLPARSITLEVLALALQHPSPDFGSCWMALARIGDALHIPERNSRIDELCCASDKLVPLVILGHGYWTRLELLGGVKSFIGFASKDASIGIVCFLDLAHNNPLQFTTRVLQVQECL